MIRLRMARWLLWGTEYAVIDAGVIDDLIATARRCDLERIQQLQREVKDARAWATLQLLEEFGEVMGYSETQRTH